MKIVLLYCKKMVFLFVFFLRLSLYTEMILLHIFEAAIVIEPVTVSKGQLGYSPLVCL